MADSYPHALLVEFEPNQVPKLKNKLTKYFQSKRLSGGGDCTVELRARGPGAELRFRAQRDQRSVLERASHQLSLEDGALRLTVRLPEQEPPSPSDSGPASLQVGSSTPSPSSSSSPPGGGGEGGSLPTPLPGSGAPRPGSSPSLLPRSTASPAPSVAPRSTASIVENLAADVTQEFVEMLVENIMKKQAAEGFTVEMIPALKSAAVSFKTGQDNAEFLLRCPGNRTFKSKALTGRALAPPTQLLLEEAGLNEDVLLMLFEKDGVEAQKVEVDTERQRTVVSFSSAADVQKLLQKPPLMRKKELKLYPFHQCLGRALYGADKPPLKLPPPLVLPADPALLQLLRSRPSELQELQTQLQNIWSRAELLQDALKLSPEPTLLQQEEAELQGWSASARSLVSRFLSRFEVWKLNPPPDLWKQSLEKVSALLVGRAQVLLVPQETDGLLKVVGPRSDISELQEPLCESVNSIIKRARREKDQVTEQVKVPMRVFHLLSRDGLQQKLLAVYPEMQFDTRSGPFPKVTGLTEEIANANKLIYEAMLALEKQNVDLDRYVLEFMRGDEQEEQINAMLSRNHAVYESAESRVRLLAFTEEDLSDAQELLKAQLVSQYVKAEDGDVLRSGEWKQLLARIQNDHEKERKKVQVLTQGDQVVVSGFRDAVASVAHELDDFLKQNAQIQESVAVKPAAKLEYLRQLGKSKLDALRGKNVEVSFAKDGLSLSGARARVEVGVGLVREALDSVAFEALVVVKHGARKVFEDGEVNYLASIGNQTGCLVAIADDVPAAGAFPKPVYEAQTPDGVRVFVANADMCGYPAHAIVNAAVEDLQLKSGLAAALLKAAGPQLQVECDRIHVSRGDLSPGECEVTNAGGTLACRKIIHAVGPRYDQAHAASLLKRAVRRSLELAEQHQCESLAVPAVSRNRNFPLRECARVIVSAVSEHCEERGARRSLKSVHLVSNEEAAVKAMEEAVKQEFGGRGGAAAPPAAPPAPRPALVLPPAPVASPWSGPLVSPPAPVDPNCLGKEVTKEGLEFSIIKGHLEKATTDVIVNTVTAGLDLNQGAVSKAISSAAGPALQTMVQAKQTQATVGDVIVTEGANLSCQKVLHAVAPHNDNGQGAALKLLDGVFRDCLSKAEALGMTSISFSAMGTGNLGFPRPEVWALLLENVLEISRKTPKNLRRVQVVLFPGDAQTIQVFSDEFQKKFPKAGGGSSAAAAAAPPGGVFSKVVSTSSSHETKMGGVSVQVVTGDITKETTDVIVNSSNEKFSLKSGVSKAILEAAGPAVEKECLTLGAQPNDGMILTQPGNLRCQKILHLVGQTDLGKIQVSVRDALMLCTKHQLRSVAFPAIGTGQGSVAARGVADAMFDAVIDVLTTNPSSSLKTVKVVIFQKPMLKDFHDSLQHRAATPSGQQQNAAPDKPKETGVLGAIAGRIKSIFAPASPQKPASGGDFVIEAVKPAPLCFHICGDSASKVSAAKKKINSILSKNLASVPIPDESVLSLSAEARQQLVELQRRTGVGIRVEAANGRGSITVEGLAIEVPDVTNKIHEMLKAARHEEDLSQKAALLSAMVDWQYARTGDDYKSFDAKTNYELEQALEKNLKEVKVKLNGQEYTVKLPKGPASRGGVSLSVQRINKMSDLPESWENMNTSGTKAVPLTPGSPEYVTVEQMFKASCKLTITKIERIQNPVLWQSLQIKRRAMDQRNGHSNNERRLFHGTSADTVPLINEHGFNRSYAGKNATAYGNGTYFAVNALYSSSNTYSRPSANGDKLMYLCSVLTGDFTAGAQGMIDAPLKKSGSIQKFDSVVDNTSSPSMFIIFHDNHAYPEYLITFR